MEELYSNYTSTWVPTTYKQICHWGIWCPVHSVRHSITLHLGGRDIFWGYSPASMSHLGWEHSSMFLDHISTGSRPLVLRAHPASSRLSSWTHIGKGGGVVMYLGHIWDGTIRQYLSTSGVGPFTLFWNKNNNSHYLTISQLLISHTLIYVATYFNSLCEYDNNPLLTQIRARKLGRRLLKANSSLPPLSLQVKTCAGSRHR